MLCTETLYSTCALRLGSCFYFASSEDVQTIWSHNKADHPAYFARAYGHPGQESDSGNTTWYNASAALAEATRSLFKNYPSLAKDCLPSEAALCVSCIFLFVNHFAHETHSLKCQSSGHVFVPRLGSTYTRYNSFDEFDPFAKEDIEKP